MSPTELRNASCFSSLQNLSDRKNGLPGVDESKQNLDCGDTFPVDSAPNGIPFGGRRNHQTGTSFSEDFFI